MDPQDFVDALERDHGVLLGSGYFGGTTVRAMTHLDVGAEGVERAVEASRAVLTQAAAVKKTSSWFDEWGETLYFDLLFWFCLFALLLFCRSVCGIALSFTLLYLGGYMNVSSAIAWPRFRIAARLFSAKCGVHRLRVYLSKFTGSITLYITPGDTFFFYSILSRRKTLQWPISTSI